MPHTSSPENKGQEGGNSGGQEREEGTELEFTVLYFAAAREAVGAREGQVRVVCGSRDGTCCLRELAAALLAKHPLLAQTVAPDSTVMSVNCQYASMQSDMRVKPSDEIAVIPPISGG
jgi:molybdopterin converting factor small subunit